MPIGDNGRGLDAMEQLGALGALAEAFDLDDSLLSDTPPQTVGAWLDWVMQAHVAGDGRMTVATSGSTGSPRPCVHDVDGLLGEAAFLATQFVVPKPDHDPVQLSAQIEQVIVARLAHHERPKSFRFGPALPRNAMGKLEDWA